MHEEFRLKNKKLADEQHERMLQTKEYYDNALKMEAEAKARDKLESKAMEVEQQ